MIFSILGAAVSEYFSADSEDSVDGVRISTAKTTIELFRQGLCGWDDGVDHGQFQILVTLFLVNRWTDRHLMIPDIQHRRRYLALVLVVPHLDPMHAPSTNFIS